MQQRWLCFQHQEALERLEDSHENTLESVQRTLAQERRSRAMSEVCFLMPVTRDRKQSECVALCGSV